MDVAQTSPTTVLEPGGVWRLSWLTAPVCRGLLLALIAFDIAAHLHYLHHNCPLDLAGDEAQYWDWSRRLDWSYYSKGPLVAYIIRASTSLFGSTMPAVRYPAVLFGAGTLLLVYLLTRKLFRSDRLALGAVLLFHIVPMFVAGSVLMTIDPPYFLCWGLATYLLSFVLLDEKRWPWPVIGVVVGLGFLAKYAMFAWFVPMLIALAIDRGGRKWLKTIWPYASLLIAAIFTTPVLWWNSRHGWVSAAHVGKQTGAVEGGFHIGNVLELLLGQIAIVGPGIFLFMVAGVVLACRHRTVASPGERRGLKLLSVFGCFFFLVNLLLTLHTKVQMNWPAPAYFTLVILAAYFLSTRLRSRQAWKPWRPWFWFSVVFGLISMPLSHYSGLVYPLADWFNRHVVTLRQPWHDAGGVRKTIARVIPAEPLDGTQIDFAYKLKGWQEAGDLISHELHQLGPGSFALCHDYQQTAELAFYLRGQPITYYAGSWYQDDPGRMTQYDLWADRDLSPSSSLVGKNAIFLGRHPMPFPDLLNAFERVEGVDAEIARKVDGVWVKRKVQQAIMLNIEQSGVPVRAFRYFRCYGFKGMQRSAHVPH